MGLIIGIIFLLFEIQDKIIPSYSIYLVLGTLGVIGFLLGFWKWWLGVIWLVLPIIYINLILDDVTFLYEEIVNKQGKIYIFHAYFASLLAIIINSTGVFIGFRKKQKLV